MALSKEAASAVIAKYGVNEHDTGNTKVRTHPAAHGARTRLSERQKRKARAVENRRCSAEALKIFRADKPRSVPLSYQRARYP